MVSVLLRFLANRKKSDQRPQGEASPSGNVGEGLGLQVVFSGALPTQAAAVAQSLRHFHASMKEVTCEFEPGYDLIGMVEWGRHVVSMFGLNAPFPREQLELCVGPAHYSQEIKEQVRNNRSHVVLWYDGPDETPVRERYTAMACVAEALADFGAIAVLNETGRTSLPTGWLKSVPTQDSLWDLLSTMPLTMLYCGLVKYGVEGTSGVWMRTYGADRFGLPDFAVLAGGHDEASNYNQIFNNIWSYLLNSGAQMAAGHTMQIGAGHFLKLRDPSEAEYFLHGPAKVLVASIIGANEIN